MHAKCLERAYQKHSIGLETWLTGGTRSKNVRGPGFNPKYDNFLKNK